MSLLQHENEIFLEAFHEDGLLITAKGLGLENIFINFLKLYGDQGNLVIVLNTTSSEEEYFLWKLKSNGINPLPKVITSENGIADRKDIYLHGGVLFVSSRILTVDMLTQRLPVHLITGILVYKAHKIIDSCQEAFILRLFRQQNKKGFIKAFSDSPISFTAGFCHVERVMKSLFVRKLFLWPRFHASVVSNLEKHKVDVVELSVELTQSMIACQTCLLDLINACIKEIKKANPMLDTDEITVENAITRSFEKIVKMHLDPVWHQLGPKTKQLISDIHTLRKLLEYLTQYDCVNFYNLVTSIRTSQNQFGSGSGWLYLESADSLYVHSRARVFGSEDKSKKQKTSKVTSDSSGLEECPKWHCLKEVLEEIQVENKRLEAECGKGAVLVVAQDDRTCSQIKEYLCIGGQKLLERLYEKNKKLKSAKNESSPVKGKSTIWKTVESEKNTLTLTQMINTDDEDKQSEAVELKKEESAAELSDGYEGVLKCAYTVIHPLHGSSDPYTLLRVLSQVKPRFVVMYDTNMTFIRQVEVFHASEPSQPLRCYFLMYSGSSEEQKYLTSLRKEKEAFEYLIKQKAVMVIPEEREGKDECDDSLFKDTAPTNATVNTRKGGLQKVDENEAQKIIVDMREFRSDLPSLIHRRGIEIEPVTIEVGDYILTPDICVERKSISDLIGSLNNGRLYNQCVSMCRFYLRPILLIEFDPNKSFALQGIYQLKENIQSSDVISRLTLLTIHFPRLRILWCQSPYASADLFQEIKMGRPQPSAEKALEITAETAEDITADKYSLAPQTMLLKMPGINSKNVALVMNKVENFVELVKLSIEQLTDILKNESNAKKLHAFLHKSNTEPVVCSGASSNKSKMLAAASVVSKSGHSRTTKRKK